MNPRTLPRLFRTVRPLRLSQILWRCRAIAERRRQVRRPAARDVVLRDEPFPRIPLFHRVGLEGTQLVEELERGRFTYLQRSLDLGRESPDWRLGRVSSDRLWTITLHYHEWVYSLAEVAAGGGAQASTAASLLSHYLSDWMRRSDVTAPGARELAWNSFAIATRIGAWVRAWSLLHGPRPAEWVAIERPFLASLQRQASWLHGHLEWDLRGNHLLRDLVGLAWAGRFFGDAEAASWTATAARHLPAQLAEQVLPDGGHFERSPTYHIHVMEDLLSLFLLLEDPESTAELAATWSRMARWLVWMRHPDGRVPLLNDGGMNALCEPARLFDLGRAHGLSTDASRPVGGRLFSDSGVVVWHGEPWSLFFDVGRIGADHVPGHGHADTLTLECSHRGRRLIVDPGTHAYDGDERRRYDRSTAAHNTVCLDDRDSSEVWDLFRVGRRARPLDVRAVFEAGGFEASAAHDGYRHLDGRPLHRRRVTLRDGGALVVEDAIEGRGRHRARGGVLLDPAWEVQANGSGWTLSRDDVRLRVTLDARGATPRLEPSRQAYHPDYGVEHESWRLDWHCEAELPFEIRMEIAEA